MRRLATATAPDKLMLANYPGDGARYVAHLDNDPDDPAHQEGPVGLRACDRVFTCILYLNEEWVEAHEGCLRIFTSGGAEPDNPWHQAEDEEEDEEAEEAGGFVDIEPRGGRLVVFDSKRMLHEVRPSYASRWALTAWV